MILYADAVQCFVLISEEEWSRNSLRNHPKKQHELLSQNQAICDVVGGVGNVGNEIVANKKRWRCYRMKATSAAYRSNDCVMCLCVCEMTPLVCLHVCYVDTAIVRKKEQQTGVKCAIKNQLNKIISC